jgi:branched-chain amino acid transport system ATP-binding protein
MIISSHKPLRELKMLELRNVSKDFDGLRAVNDVSLSVEKGEIVGLIGPNGSGKSTLLNVISGRFPATSGTIYFQEEDITRLSPDRIFNRGLGRGFQDPSLFYQMTVLDNTILPAKYQKGEKPFFAPFKWFWRAEETKLAERANSILSQIDLRRLFGQRASDLSGGQMKLLDIARSQMGDSRMLLLDEPTAGVAPPLAQSIFEHIANLRQNENITFFIIEHRLDMLFNFVDRVYVMHMGNILAHGTPPEILENAEVREVYFGD